MQVGLFLPQLGTVATRENVIKLATSAEKEGFDSLWVLERLLYPINPKTPYPVTPDGNLPEEYKRVFDNVDLLSFVAGKTEKIKLGTSVIDMLFHVPVVLGRRLATLDVLSQGRLICGMGIGWSEDEYETCNIPYENRGDRADEFLEAIKKVWTDEQVEYEGKYYKIAKSIIGPKPQQKPYPPLLLGGFSKKTFQRVAKYANGYIGVAAMPLDQLKGMLDGLEEEIKKSGKDPSEFKVFMLTNPVVKESSGGDERSPFTGTIEEIGSDMQRIKEIGVNHAILNFSFVGAEDTQKIIDHGKALAKYAR